MRARKALTFVLVALLLLALGAGSAAGPGRALAAEGKRDAPKTGFEQREGESWTTHEEELEFLAAVDQLSKRASVEKVGETLQGRPLHLVEVGAPKPHGRKAALRQPTVLFVCSQHGNEPAGRETCLQLLRDLAFTDDATLVEQLEETNVLFVPSANPDGSVADSRRNSQDIDINRDHMTLETAEAATIARVVRDWRPDVVLDLHEYGPSVPVVYDDEILYLWPRNLNVDGQVHDLAKELAIEYIGKGAEEAGYSSDEYGIYAVGDQDVYQTAGDHDPGIARNAFGLRHALGILIESAVTPDARNGPGQEVLSEAETNLRRVASQLTVSLETLRFMREQGDVAAKVTAGAFRRKAKEGRKQSAPVYFGGADNDEPEEDEIQDPPPCAYEITQEQLKTVGRTLALLDIAAIGGRNDELLVPMGQSSEPVIPMVLDARAERHSIEGEPLQECA